MAKVKFLKCLEINSVEQSYYPPPPAPPPARPPEMPPEPGFHLPPTHLFMRIRAHLFDLEGSLPQCNMKDVGVGLVIALALGATLSIVLSAIFEFFIPLSTGLLAITFAPLFEESFKGLSVLLVAVFFWKSLPSSRYGALLGAAAGLGFELVETLLYSIGFLAENNLTAVEARLISIPFGHILFSAFVGMGVFVILAQRKTNGSPSWLAVPFFLLGLAAHALWNLAGMIFEAAFPASTIATTVLIIAVVFAPFALILRDLLGGHFNFQNFLMRGNELPPFPVEGTIQPLPPPP